LEDNMKKQIILGIILAVLTIGITTAFSGSGTGTSTNPYIITTCTQLQEMNNNVSAYYIIGNNIDCTATSTWNSGAGFVPISLSPSNDIHLDGKGYNITNLYQNRTTGWSGLIGTGARIIVSNVRLVNVNIQSSGQYVGGLIGQVVGGSGTSAVISNCSVTGTVTGTSTSTGGLIGRLGVGYYDVYLYNSYSRATVIGYTNAGGLVGSAERGQIYNSYSTGAVSGLSGVGGLVGVQTSGTATSSYWDTQTSGRVTSALGTGRTTAQMQTQSTYSGWDFTNLWIMSGYPVYELIPCVENWVLQYYPATCRDVLHIIYYTDTNNCGTTYLLPANNNTMERCTPDNSSNVPGWDLLITGQQQWQHSQH